MADEITVIIADDHPIVRQGLRQALALDAGLKVVAEASDGRSALEQVAALKPDVVILDIDMPELDGFGVARAIRERQLEVGIIFLTIHREEDFFDEALRLGAKGYVLKDSPPSDIVACVKAVAVGESYASPALTSYLFNRRTSSGSRKAATPGVKDLSPTELRVLKLISEYKTNKEIAEQLFISHRTVETHRTNICTKLEIHGSHALMKFALAHKSELPDE